MHPSPRHYSSLRALYRCFYDRQLYTDVRERWNGLGFAYLFLVTSLLMIPAAIFLQFMLDRITFDEHNTWHKELAAMASEVIAQMPEVTWHDGAMHSPAPQPYVIHITWEDEQVPFAIISEEAGIDDLEKSKAMLLLTKDRIYVKKQDKIEVQNWTEMHADELTLNADSLRVFADMAYQSLREHRMMIHLLMGLTVTGVLLLSMQLYRMAQALLFGLLALGVARLYRTALRYDVAVRLAAVALTPAIAINAVLTAAGAGGISIGMSATITLCYLAFALKPRREAI